MEWALLQQQHEVSFPAAVSVARLDCPSPRRGAAFAALSRCAAHPWSGPFSHSLLCSLLMWLLQDNENILVSCSGDGSIKVWDLSAAPQSNPIRSFHEHSREVGCGWCPWSGVAGPAVAFGMNHTQLCLTQASPEAWRSSLSPWQGLPGKNRSRCGPTSR